MNTTPVFSRWFANVRHRRVIYLTSLQQPHGFCLCANCIAARLLHLNTRLLSSFEGEGLIHCDSLRSHCYKPVCPCVRHWSWLNSFPAGSGWTEVRMLVVCVLGKHEVLCSSQQACRPLGPSAKKLDCWPNDEGSQVSFKAMSWESWIFYLGQMYWQTMAQICGFHVVLPPHQKWFMDIPLLLPNLGHLSLFPKKHKDHWAVVLTSWRKTRWWNFTSITFSKISRESYQLRALTIFI